MHTSIARVVSLTVVLTAMLSTAARAQDDGGTTDGGGQEILESIFIPPIQHAAFSLTLATEWSRPLRNGGSYTVVNSRPIKRDSAGRIYEERWLLSPKGTNIPSRMSWIQIADPVAGTLYDCTPRQHLCELNNWIGAHRVALHPELTPPGTVKTAKGSRTHEDLGKQFFAGVPVHQYRDTTTLDPGTMGNDQPMSIIRDFRFSEELGLNLTSVVDNPQFGRQSFTVAELTTTEPDPKFFLPPEGYTIVDKRIDKRIDQRKPAASNPD
jgi:hypothetical protein